MYISLLLCARQSYFGYKGPNTGLDTVQFLEQGGKLKRGAPTALRSGTGLI